MCSERILGADSLIIGMWCPNATVTKTIAFRTQWILANGSEFRYSVAPSENVLKGGRESTFVRQSRKTFSGNK